MADDERPPFVSVPCTVRLTHGRAVCWSCSEPADYLPPLPSATIARGYLYVVAGTPIRHKPGCTQLSLAEMRLSVVKDLLTERQMEADDAEVPDHPDR